MWAEHCFSFPRYRTLCLNLVQSDQQSVCPPGTLRPQLKVAAPAVEGGDTVHFDSMPPASLGIWVKLFQISLVEGSARRLQQPLTIWLGLPGLFQ